jgi:cyclomaltodextrinase / maltogenic alpha-amylase / neopullulanase
MVMQKHKRRRTNPRPQDVLRADAGSTLLAGAGRIARVGSGSILQAGRRSTLTLSPPTAHGALALLLFLTLALAACDSNPVTPVGPDPEPDGHAFVYTPPTQAPAVSSVAVRGTFNGWGERVMTRQADGSWRAVVDLPDGTHQYKFFINGSWPTDMCDDRTWGLPGSDYWIDPAADGCMEDGHGGRNAVLIVGSGPGLGFAHVVGSPTYVSRAGDRLSVRFRANRGAVQSATVTVGDATHPMHLQLRLGLQEVWRASLPPGTSSYGFVVETADGPRTFGPYGAPASPFSDVAWVGDAVGYQIFPERFWNGDPTNDHWTLETDVVNYMHPATWDIEPVLMDTWGGQVLEFHCCHQYFGGDLQGILDRLDHLEQLGVTFLYLNPIFTSGSAHGYDTYDYLEVAPNFGDEALLRTLLDAAKARGIRVMWDFVPNHTGVGFWAFQEAADNGPASPYWSWFNFNVDWSQLQVGNGNHYDAWWGFGTLPRLETRHDSVFQHLLDVTRHWTEFGFDGIRVDVPNEIRNRSQFFTAFRQAAKSINPDVYLVGEIWGRDASWLQGDQFDALMNYAVGEGVVERFARGELTGGSAADEMARVYAEYPEASTAMQFNLISSHDTGRLLTKMGGGPLGGAADATSLARQKLAAAMLYALPGVPVTFQGDECAFLGTGDGPREENRYPFQWQDCDAAMVAHYARLAELRGELAALRSPVIRSHAGAGAVLSFFRGEPGDGEVLAMFNSGPAPASPTLPAGTWIDAATGESFSGSASLAARGWRYLWRG